MIGNPFAFSTIEPNSFVASSMSAMSSRAQLGKDALQLAAIAVVAIMVFAASVLTLQRIGSLGSSRLIDSTVSGPSGSCLLEVPFSAEFGSYGNSTVQGYTVTYANGTEALFPYDSCPVPVTPDNYRIDSVVEANPKFVAIENGTIYQATNGCNCTQTVNISAANGSTWTVLNFVRYGNQRIYPCGPNDYWTYERTGLIWVTIPFNSTGGLVFSQMDIRGGPGNFNFGSCTTTLVVTSGQTP